ncbi:MAG: glycine--tRNA ligase subunit beta [bacterium JZ-2024 1]
MPPQTEHNEFLLEVGVEDLPPAFQLRLIQEEEDRKERLRNKGVRWDRCRIYVTPRRIVLHAEKIQLDPNILEREITGPPLQQARDEKGNWTLAAHKFAEKLHRRIHELYTVRKNDREFLAGKVKFTLSLKQHLAQIVPEWILSLNELYEKRMRWGEENFSFIRPIRWILALLNSQIVPFSLGSLHSNRFTFTHFYSGFKKVRIPACTDYFRYVPLEILDIQKKREFVLQQIPHVTREFREVDFTYELPGWGFASFPSDFLSLPPEVIEAVISKQLRCYPLYDEKGKLLPRFLFTVDHKEGDWNREEVQKGYEAVANARLTDALYFYHTDIQIPFHQRKEQLKGIQFLQGMGSYFDKTLRLEWMIQHLPWTEHIPALNLEILSEAVSLCRADQTTQMVREFTDLEGIIGRAYLENPKTPCHLTENIRPHVARVIFESYLPRGSEDVLPQTLEGSVLSVADKMDSLLAFFFSGYKPSGTKDPLGARRLAAHILRIIFSNSLPIPLQDFLQKTAEGIWKKQVDERFFQEIFEERAEHLSREGISGWNYDIFLICKKYLFPHPLYFYRLQKFLIQKRGPQLSEYARIATRVHNLACEAPPSLSSQELKKEIFAEPEEENVYSSVLLAWEKWRAERQPYSILFPLEKFWEDWLHQVTPERIALLDRFFDRVLVMHPDEKIRFNRLILLKRLDDCLQILGDMSASGRSMEVLSSSK